MHLRTGARLLVALTAAVGVAVAAPPDTVVLPAAETADSAPAGALRVTVAADGTITFDGRRVPRASAAIILPDLTGPLRTAHVARPDDPLLLAADRRVDFRAVREVLATSYKAGISDVRLLAAASGGGARGLRVRQDLGYASPAAPVAPAVALAPLTVHLRADRLAFVRHADHVVTLPRAAGGALDWMAFAHLLDEDKRLHPGQDLVVLTTDDGVAYADTFVTLDLTRAYGFPRTLLAGGPPVAPDGPPPKPPSVSGAPAERPDAVALRADGGLDLRGVDGTFEPVPAAAITDYEAHCDTKGCDLVARTATRRVSIGPRPANGLVPGWLFGKRVHTYAGRLGIAAPARTGALSPLVQHPGGDLPNTSTLPLLDDEDSILLGKLDQRLIDDVMRRESNMRRVSDCYAAVLFDSPDAAGRVTVNLVIGGDGTVRSATIKATEIPDESMLACVQSTVSSYVFPKPEGGGIVIVSYPFVFRSE